MAQTARSRPLVAAILLLVAFGTLQPSAAEQNEVRFCFNDWPPYVQLRDGEAVGISVDILREAARRANLNASFQELPWKRCLEMVRTGNVDAVVDAMQRPDYLQGPTSFSIYTNTVWVRAEDPVRALDFGALRGRKIGLVDGYEYPASLLADIESVGIVTEHSVDDGTNIRKLAFGRVDAIVADFASTLLFVKENRLHLRALEPMHSADKLYASFHMGKADLQQNIDRALQQMIEDGFIDGVYSKHLGTKYSDLPVPVDLR